MNRSAILMAVLLLAACSSNEVTSGPLSGTSRFVGDSDIEDMVEMENGRIEFSESDLPVYQVDLINNDEDDVQAEYMAHWYDDRGIEVNDPTRGWRPIFIAGGGRHPIRVFAPSVEATRCEVEVRLPHPLGS